MQWQAVIGLEIHTRLKTRSKLFSGAAAQYGAAPNEQVCPIDAAFPGVLPVLNKEVIKMAISFGLSINAQIARRTIFARKSYFYPDLPKGYQISQYEHPIITNGELQIMSEDGTCKTIGITRAHLEEDAGKSVHSEFDGMSGIDLNRAGIPLIEIVSEPDMNSAAEAGAYMRKIHSIVRYLDICDGNMQEGSFRCDANVSVRPAGSEKLGQRAEVKNVNSFRFVERAIAYEIERQIEILEEGGTVRQETRLFNVDTGRTHAMRSKEESHDYQYFPDPDLLPVVIDEHQIREVRATLPELPAEKSARFAREYGLAAQDIERLVADRALADYFESCVKQTKASSQIVANWMNGALTAMLKKHNLLIESAPISNKMLAQLLDYLHDEVVSNNNAREAFVGMWEKEGTAEQIIDQKGLRQMDDSVELERIIDALIENSPKQVAQYRSGKEKVFGYFVGQVMQVTKQKANPKETNRLLKNKLSE